jgi:replication factor C small subunit
MSFLTEEEDQSQPVGISADIKSQEEIVACYEENLKNTLWVERYRPKSIAEYVGDENLKSRISKILDSGDIPNLILHGPPGTGKTTIAKMIVNSVYCDSMYINASDENGIDVIREKITDFARATGFNNIKIIILDEASEITMQAQNALRSVIETFSGHTRFILTANAVERMHPAIISRCQSEKIVPPSKPHIAKHIVNILESEGVKYELKDVAKIININYPDIRKTIGAFQQYSRVTGTLKLDDLDLSGNNIPAKIVDILRSNSNNAFNEIRQVVANSGIYNFDAHYKYLFDTVDDWSDGASGNCIVILAEMQYKSGIVPDREINFMSCIAQLLQIISK